MHRCVCKCVRTDSIRPTSGNFTKSREKKRMRERAKKESSQIPVFSLHEKLHSKDREGEKRPSTEQRVHAEKWSAARRNIGTSCESGQERFKMLAPDARSIFTFRTEEMFTILFSLCEPLTQMKMDEMSPLPAFVLGAQSEQ